MDAKVTLSFNKEVIEKGKQYAEANGISLSRLTEILLQKVISSGSHEPIESLPIADWVGMVAEGPAEYNTGAGFSLPKKDEYYKSRRKKS